MTSPGELSSALRQLSELVRPAVLEIEDSTPATRGHYGAYMSIIQKFSKGDQSTAVSLAAALRLAGANHQGVLDALQILHPGAILKRVGQ